MVPISPSKPNFRAPSTVAARKTPIGGMPPNSNANASQIVATPCSTPWLPTVTGIPYSANSAAVRALCQNCQSSDVPVTAASNPLSTSAGSASRNLGRFDRLRHISNGHIHNLRKARDYRLGALSIAKTRPVHVSIGIRRRPDPRGRPGFVRVDTVHQGDLNGEKGVYVFNVVDQITQFEHIGAAVRASEYFLPPVLEDLLQAFPFHVRGFHADNGSEYVNHHVARLLNKLHIGEFTKSRPRRSNDNALVESKNGAIVRKWLGRAHIPAERAPAVNDFLRDHLCPFLNFHRPCLFPSEIECPRGRVRRRYRQRDVATPHEKLKSLPDAESFLRDDVTFEQLDKTAAATSGLEAAKAVGEARRQLFRNLADSAA